MALQEVAIAFKFAGGVETKMDSKAVPATRLLTLENGVFSRAISIQKRNGYEALSRAVDGRVAPLDNARRLAKRDDELLLFTHNRCYSKQSGADRWTDAGALIAPVGRDRSAPRTGTQQTTPDHATSAGVAVYAWEDSRGGVWWTTVDAATGRVYREPAQASGTGERPRCLAVGGALHIYYAVPARRTIECVVVNPTTLMADTTPRIVVSDLDATNPAYDVVATDRPGAPALIAWHEHATSNIRIGFVTASAVLGSPVTGHPSVRREAVELADDSPIAVAVAGGAVPHDGVATAAVAYQHLDTMEVAFFVIGTSILLAAQQALSPVASVQRIAATFAGDRCWVAAEEYADEPSERYCVVNSATEAVTGTPQVIRSVGLASRAFAIGDNAFVVFVHDATYFNTYITLRLSDFAPAGRHLAAQASAPTRAHLPTAHVDGSEVAVVLPSKQRLSSVNNDKFSETALSRVTLDFDSEDSHQTAQLGRGLYLGGACPMHYDGRAWTEQGFHVGPERITHDFIYDGDLTPDGKYLYRAWYEWSDAQGEIHRGPVSIGTPVNTADHTSVTLTLPTLRVTRKRNVRICVARSLPGDATRLWRVSSLDPTTAGEPNGYVANDPTVDRVTFTDNMSDADLQKQEPIYTTGGILSNDPAALGSHIAAGKNRLFFTDASAGNIVRFSQRLATGFGAEIAPEMQHDVDPYGGDILALRVMDDVVFAFKASAIFAFNGDGPLENGDTAVSGFSASQLITSDVGCSDPSSIVLTPQGLMFKSAKGIYLLDRSRQVHYVGAPVEAYNAQAVRRAVALPDRPAVVFLTDSGKTLYFDHLFAQWSTFTNHEGLDAAFVAGRLHYLRSSGIVYRETPGRYSDAGSRIPLRLETAWIRLHEHLQGFQRIWKLLLLGTWASPHQLAVQHRLSYDEAWSDPYYLDATGEVEGATGWITGDSANPIGEDPILGSQYGDGPYGDGPYGGRGPDVYQWRYGVHENAQAVQFRFEDFEKAGLTGASFELTEMTIIGGIMKPDIRPFAGPRST